MKKPLILCMLLLSIASTLLAQENIHFVVSEPQQEGLSQSVHQALKLKVEQIVARNNAGAASVHNAFVVEPTLTIGQTLKTEGLLREVTLVTGELSLIVRNKYDNSVYGTTAIELQGDATGNQEQAIASLISNIKVTNPAFVRFIRTTRKRIIEFYEQNCEVILKKAHTLSAAGRTAEAVEYLSPVPATASCYTEVEAMVNKLTGKETQGEVSEEALEEVEEEVQVEQEAQEVQAEQKEQTE